MNTILRSVNRVLSTNKSCFCTAAQQIVYKSAISTQNLYPNSNPKLLTPNKVTHQPTAENQVFSGYIPIDKLNISYSRSSGPGGQHVNTVNSKVDLRFNIQEATWIPEEIKPKLIEKFKSRINKEGCLVFRSELTRSQQLNLADCLQKVRTAIYSLITTEHVISKETEEKLRRRHERAIRERLQFKRQRSQIKSDRKDPVLEY